MLHTILPYLYAVNYVHKYLLELTGNKLVITSTTFISIVTWNIIQMLDLITLVCLIAAAICFFKMAAIQFSDQMETLVTKLARRFTFRKCMFPSITKIRQRTFYSWHNTTDYYDHYVYAVIISPKGFIYTYNDI